MMQSIMNKNKKRYTLPDFSVCGLRASSNKAIPKYEKYLAVYWHDYIKFNPKEDATWNTVIRMNTYDRLAVAHKNPNRARAFRLSCITMHTTWLNHKKREAQGSQGTHSMNNKGSFNSGEFHPEQSPAFAPPEKSDDDLSVAVSYCPVRE